MKESYSDLELELLNYSFIELLIVQTLYQLKQRLSRHKLLLHIQHTVGENALSTARFYRILAKLEKKDLVNQVNDESHNYFVTSKGIEVINKSKSILDQVGLQVTSFFENDIEKIKQFSRYKSGKVLFVDFAKLFDLELLSLLSQHFENLSILCDDEIYSWMSATLTTIKQTKYEESIIKEPDNSFNLVILFYPGLENDLAIFNELYRVLNQSKSLLVLDSINPLEKYDHFAVDVIANKFWRIPFSSSESLAMVENQLKKCFNNKIASSLNIKGLELRLFIK